MARFARVPAGLAAAGPRHGIRPNGTMEHDPDTWPSDHALTLGVRMVFMANEPLAGIVRFAFRRIFGARPERPWC